MKTINILLCLLFLFSHTLISQSDSDVLMTVGDADVTVGEFRYIYEKNNGAEANYSQESLSEYLGLYKKFKLKVQEAKSMRLDTVAALREELAGYRKQLASSFLSDREIIDEIVNEVHERQKQDIEISHLLISVKPTAPDADKVDAEQRILAYKKELAGSIVFGALAGQYSEDKNSSRQRGYLGFTSAMLPSGFYEFENAIYNAEAGDVVGPVWSKLGCHLIEVKSKRPARGLIKVAHILVKPKANTPKSDKRAEATADSIHNALVNGAKWNILVQRHTQDTKTVKQNGELPVFGISTYEKSFEDASFALQAAGEYSEPIKTNSGYHIIKLIEKVAPESKDDLKKRLKDKIKKYDRYEAAEEKLIQTIKKKSGFKENKDELSAFASNQTPEFYSYKWVPSIQEAKPLFSIDNKSFSTTDFAAYCKENTRARSQFDKSKPLPEAVEVMYQSFVNSRIMSYQEENLEEKYPAFRSLMREYEEGILLFEATKIAVWDKANQDTVGLQKFYDQNKNNYLYDKRAVIGTYTVKTEDPKVLKKVQKCASKRAASKTMSRFNKNGTDLVQYSTRSVPIEDPTYLALQTQKNKMSEAKMDKKVGAYVFEKIASIEEPRTKTLKEARGYVVADYQDQLEKNWVDQLQKKYAVKMNEPVYNSLLK